MIYLLINRIKNIRTPRQVSGPVIRSYPAPAVVCYVTPRFSPNRAALVLRHVVWVITSRVNALRSTELSENLRHSSNNRRNLLYVPFLQYWECFAIILTLSVCKLFKMIQAGETVKLKDSRTVYNFNCWNFCLFFPAAHWLIEENLISKNQWFKLRAMRMLLAIYHQLPWLN